MFIIIVLYPIFHALDQKHDSLRDLLFFTSHKLKNQFVTGQKNIFFSQSRRISLRSMKKHAVIAQSSCVRAGPISTVVYIAARRR